MSKPYFASAYLRLLYRFVQAEGLSDAELFEGTASNPDEIMAAGFELPFEDQVRFCLNAVERSDHGLGLRVGHQLQLAAHGALGVAMQTAPDLKAALDAFAEFLKIRANFFSLNRDGASDLLTGQSKLTISIDLVPDALVPFFCESLIHSLVHCLSFYSGNYRADIELAYSQPPYSDRYRAVFGGAVAFDCAETAITFDAKLLAIPSPEADSVSFRESMARCQRISHVYTQESSVTDAVEVFLLENPGKLWTLNEVADLFSMSGRSLIRRLRAEGGTYQSVRDSVLRRQALNYLGTMSNEAAAIALGFSDTSSFRRTFKRWFGQPPSEYVNARAEGSTIDVNRAEI